MKKRTITSRRELTRNIVRAAQSIRDEMIRRVLAGSMGDPSTISQDDWYTCLRTVDRLDSEFDRPKGTP